MKVGDLVYMPNGTFDYGPTASDGYWQVGIVTDIDVNFPGSNKRIGVFWMDSDRVEYEPPSWLEVVKE